jgi:hypothetical protein
LLWGRSYVFEHITSRFERNFDILLANKIKIPGSRKKYVTTYF